MNSFRGNTLNTGGPDDQSDFTDGTYPSFVEYTNGNGIGAFGARNNTYAINGGAYPFTTEEFGKL